VIHHLGPLVALAPVTGKHSPETVLIVDGTLVPTHDRTVAARSKNHRHSTNVQVVIDANTLLVVAVGKPLPGNRNDCPAFTESTVDRSCVGATVMADGGYQGTGVIMPYRQRSDGTALPAWQEELNTVHRDPGGLDRHPVRSAIRWSDRGGRAIMVGIVRDRV
jgi:Transposase DDE domain